MSLLCLCALVLNIRACVWQSGNVLANSVRVRGPKENFAALNKNDTISSSFGWQRLALVFDGAHVHSTAYFEIVQIVRVRRVADFDVGLCFSELLARFRCERVLLHKSVS